jgi:hypothetical membrane protein
VISTARSPGLTRSLLIGGTVAGPIYILVGAVEILARPGFDMTRHDLSLMANGAWGWVHIALLIVTGLLTIGAAIGLWRALHGSIGGTWGPLLIGLYGVGLVGAGIFTADPAFGFPPGTPADYHAVSWHGLLHLVSGSIGFLGLIAACIVFARRFARRGQRGLAVYSVATGALYLAAFAGIAAGSNGPRAVMTAVILAFTVAVVLGWAWISVLTTLVRRDVSMGPGTTP